MNAMPLHAHHPSRQDILKVDALGVLSEFAGDLVGIEDADALLWAVAERTISRLGWVDCVIYLRDPHRDILIQKAAFGPKSIDYKAIFQPIEIPLGRGVVGKVANAGVAMRIDDTSQFKDYIADDETRLSELAVPIRWGSEVLGVIDSEHPSKGFYTQEDQLILETIAGITATKIQNAQSAQRNAELALFYERNPNAVLQVDAFKTITFINLSARQSFPERLECGDILDRDGLDNILKRAKEKGHTTWRCEHVHPLTNQITTEEYQVVHLPTGHFNLYGNDITHLLDLQKAAQAANEAKSRFLSVMSHEIRTPLNAILGLTDLLIHDNPEREEQLRHLAYMEFSGRHLLSLVNDILDLERMASGKATLLSSEFNFHDLLSNIMDSFRNRAERVGLALTLQCAPNVPEILTSDPKWITQILNNLISNSIKYTEQGSIEVHVQSVEASSPAAPHTLLLQVTDTGKGIAPHEQERILQPFEQIRTDSNIEGTGLGLAIVKGIVDQMSGTLTLDSAPGQGSTFTVEFPIHAMSPHPLGLNDADREPVSHPEGNESPTDTPTAPPMEAPANLSVSQPLEDTSAEQQHPCPILLADDNELNRFVASKLLARWGFDVREATNGREAIESWQEIGPCIILMDVQMPEMDGIDATRHIRSEEHRQGIRRSPILALTADAEQATFEKIMDCGMDDRIVKPFDPPALKGIMDRVMAQFMATSLS
ncbi:MAG: ATP-binding protein [Flavobacteriales bacterium]